VRWFATKEDSGRSTTSSKCALALITLHFVTALVVIGGFAGTNPVQDTLLLLPRSVCLDGPEPHVADRARDTEETASSL
jgi:hypothetical protein